MNLKWHDWAAIATVDMVLVCFARWVLDNSGVSSLASHVVGVVFGGLFAFVSIMALESARTPPPKEGVKE